MCQPDATLVPVKEKPAYSPLFPQRSGPISPVLAALPWPLSLPLPLPATPAAPPGAASPRDPRCPLIWSDTATYSRRRSSQRRLSYPRVPVVCSPLSLCSYGSVTIEQSHMGAPQHCVLNPQWSHRSAQHAHRVEYCSSTELRTMGFNFKSRQINHPSYCTGSLCRSFLSQKLESRERQ